MLRLLSILIQRRLAARMMELAFMIILQDTQQLHKALLKKRFTQLHNKSVRSYWMQSLCQTLFVLACMAHLRKDWGNKRPTPDR
jgi:hypothetical protein